MAWLAAATSVAALAAAAVALSAAAEDGIITYQNIIKK